MADRKATTAGKARAPRKGIKATNAGRLRDEVARLVDGLPEEKLEFARGYLEHLTLETDDDEVLTPEERARLYDKIVAVSDNIGSDTFSGVFSYAGMPWAEAERNMTLFAKQVMPELQKLPTAAERRAKRAA